jgi:hypothetical protein
VTPLGLATLDLRVMINITFIEDSKLMLHANLDLKFRSKRKYFLSVVLLISLLSGPERLHSAPINSNVNVIKRCSNYSGMDFFCRS